MPALVVEGECLAAVLMGGGNEVSLIKDGGNTVTTSAHPSCGKLVRGKHYRVTFEEIEPWVPTSGSG